MENRMQCVFGSAKDNEFCKGCYLADNFMFATEEHAVCEMFNRLTVMLYTLLPDSQEKENAIYFMREMIECALSAYSPDDQQGDV